MPEHPRKKPAHFDNTPIFNSGYTTKRPGVLAILIDQSGSMAQPWSKGGTDDQQPETKATVAANAVNKIVREIVGKCRQGGKFLKKVHLTIVGYRSDKTGEIPHINVICSDWIDVLAPRWWTGIGKPPAPEGMVQPFAEGGTPMDVMLRHAADAIRETLRCNNIQDSFPPTVINITDGQADDQKVDDGGQTREAADDLCSIRTNFGSLNLINVFIDPNNKGDVVFQLPVGADRFAGFLYELATPLPEHMCERAREKKFHVPEDPRGFVILREPGTLVQVLRWGSVPVD